MVTTKKWYQIANLQIWYSKIQPLPDILISKYISYHNIREIFIFYLTRWFRTAALANLDFDPPEYQIIGKIPYFMILLFFRLPIFSFFSYVFFIAKLISKFLLIIIFLTRIFQCPFHIIFIYIINVYLKIYIYIFI